LILEPEVEEAREDGCNLGVLEVKEVVDKGPGLEDGTNPLVAELVVSCREEVLHISFWGAYPGEAEHPKSSFDGGALRETFRLRSCCNYYKHLHTTGFSSPFSALRLPSPECTSSGTCFPTSATITLKCHASKLLRRL
jgi:hypothetical protein